MQSVSVGCRALGLGAFLALSSGDVSAAVLYGIAQGNSTTVASPASLIRFDSSDPGNVTHVGPTGLQTVNGSSISTHDAFVGLAYTGSSMYGWFMSPDASKAGLYQINQATGAATRVNVTDFTVPDTGYRINDLAYDPSTQTLRAIAYAGVSSSFAKIYTIDASTGQINATRDLTGPGGTAINTSNALYTLAYGPDGTAYSWSSHGAFSPTRLFVTIPSDGDATTVSPTGFSGTSSLISSGFTYDPGSDSFFGILGLVSFTDLVPSIATFTPSGTLSHNPVGVGKTSGFTDRISGIAVPEPTALLLAPAALALIGRRVRSKRAEIEGSYTTRTSTKA